MDRDISAVRSDSLRVRWDVELESLMIEHLVEAEGDIPQIRIRSETLALMNFEQASSFIGERIALLTPALGAKYVDVQTGMVKKSN